MAFPPCLSRKRPFHGIGSRSRWPFPPACRGKGRLMDLVRVCDGLSPLPVKEMAISRLPQKALGVARDGLFPLPVEEKALSWTWLAFAMAFSPCLSRKTAYHGLGARLRWAFPPACRGKGRLMDLACACDGLYLLPVDEKAVLWAWCAFAMAFSPCLSRKRPYHGLGVRLRWAFPPACRGKVCFRAPRCPPERPRKVPQSGPGAPEPKMYQI